MKDLRDRRARDLEVDLEGPDGWSRGSAWEDDAALHRSPVRADESTESARPR
jgi:hypothetical protein